MSCLSGACWRRLAACCLGFSCTFSCTTQLHCTCYAYYYCFHRLVRRTRVWSDSLVINPKTSCTQGAALRPARAGGAWRSRLKTDGGTFGETVTRCLASDLRMHLSCFRSVHLLLLSFVFPSFAFLSCSLPCDCTCHDLDFLSCPSHPCECTCHDVGASRGLKPMATTSKCRCAPKP